MAARFPYYLLADSPEGRKKQAELTGTPTDPNARRRRQRDMHKGFVYRTVPHVTLKSIANNPDIKEGMTREQIDEAIAKHADTETLYDQPYEDKDIVRLTGPFTVESLSPHRSLPTARRRRAGRRRRSPAAPRNFLTDDPRQPPQGRREGDGQEAAHHLRPARPVPRRVHPGRGRDRTPARPCASASARSSARVGDADIKKAALEAIKGSRCDLLLVCALRVRGAASTSRRRS